MKKSWTIFLGLFLIVNFATAQDTLYVYQGGSVLYKRVITAVDSITFQKVYPVAVANITDIDGNIYHSVTIGTQTWMLENLKTTHYRNGDAIPSPVTDWTALTSGAQVPYNNDAANALKYGLLYNWYAVSDSRNIAPTGWHVPTDAEWTILTTYLGGENVAGGKLKEAGMLNWASPNTSATNETGFSALPGGSRSSYGPFFNIGIRGYWWTASDEGNYSYAMGSYMYYDKSIVYSGDGSKVDAFSVRCIKNSVNIPTLTTSSASAITSSTATSGGNVTDDGGATITARGICWSTTASPTVDLTTKTSETGTIGVFSSSMTNLNANTTYYLRSYATNSAGTAYGAEISFTTLAVTPGITTTAITSITSSTATGGGNVINDGGAPISVRGICWSTTASPTADLTTKTSETGTIGVFSSSMTNLTANTTYYVRSYATNSAGTAYGAEISFTTLAAPEIITDIDGNVYTQITIGTQTWMVENLKTTRYRNGEAIANVTDNTAWAALTSGAWCDYDNASANGTRYGHLYNWYAVGDSRNIAPDGWHVPTNDEWATLSTYLGGEGVAGGKLKEAGTLNWISPNTAATNETGFSALPGGYRVGGFGTFSIIGYYSYWWSSIEGSATMAWARDIGYGDGFLNWIYFYKTDGFSIRCIKD